MVFFTVVAGLGTAALATQQVALNATSVSFLPGFGFAVAATTLVGQGLGANEPRRAERSGYLSFLWGGGLMLLRRDLPQLFDRESEFSPSMEAQQLISRRIKTCSGSHKPSGERSANGPPARQCPSACAAKSVAR